MFRRVYLDNSATTPVDLEVIEAMLPYLTEKFGNASSIHYYGQQARAALDQARHQVAALINCRPNEITFTSGGTEANNLAIRGLCHAQEKYGKHIVTSEIEHPSVKEVCDALEKQGWEITRLPVYENGIIRIEDLENAIRPDTVLVTIMAANNEIGTLQPVKEIGRVVREKREAGQKILFHTDAVQAVGKLTLDVGETCCDLLSISAHKLHAPKGVGALFVRRGVKLEPQSVGGHQERERRAGTESLANIVAFGKAAEIAKRDQLRIYDRLKALRDKLESRILAEIPDAILNGDRDNRLPNISNISFRLVEGEGLLINLDLQGVAVSTGSACSSGTLEPSPVIRALGRNDELARGAIRFSLGKENTEEDIEYALEKLPSAIASLRALSPRAEAKQSKAGTSIVESRL
jgi:cysteine desulfurase